jgi:hypothetical protein
LRRTWTWWCSWGGRMLRRAAWATCWTRLGEQRVLAAMPL